MAGTSLREARAAIFADEAAIFADGEVGFGDTSTTFGAIAAAALVQPSEDRLASDESLGEDEAKPDSLGEDEETEIAARRPHAEYDELDSAQSSGDGVAAWPANGPRARASGGSEEAVCRWCLQPLGATNRCGRTRVYCSQSCRQRAYQARKRAAQLGLKDGELVVSAFVLSRMNKRLQALDLALVEVESARLQTSDHRIAELCLAAHRLRKLTVGPSVH